LSVEAIGLAEPAGLAAEMELRSHFSGRREGERVACGLAIAVEGGGGRASGCLADVSPTGALFELVQPPFTELQSRRDLLGYVNLVETTFSGRVAIAFADVPVRLRARVVRITQAPDEEGGVLLVACRFERPLSARLRRMLGIPAGPACAGPRT
jgi:hypothetical protein